VTDPDHLWSGNWRDRRREPAERPAVARLPERPADDEPTLVQDRHGVPTSPPPSRGRGPLVPALAGGAVSAVIVSAVLLGTGLIDGGSDNQSATATVPASLPAAPSGQAASPPAKGTVGAIYASASRAVVSVQSNGGTGTGFVVGTDGTIVTNSHVVGSADEVRVRFGDSGRALRAEVLGSDPSVDIAVLHVDPASTGTLFPLALADSDQVKVGDTAIAIGNPLGLDRTATSGIVSGLGREIRAPNGFQIDKVIQTDAPINPGNSGGPLLDSQGRVIGVNSQIATSGAGSGNIGIGFAVPSNTVRNVVPQLKTGQGVKHAYLGVSTSPATSGGAQVGSVNPASPAERGGVEVGDVVTEVDGENVGAPEDISTAIADNKPGDRITMKVHRDGRDQTLNVTLGNRPSTAPSNPNTIP
jgi:putative serine protease PepD